MKKSTTLALACALLSATGAYAARGVYELPTQWHLSPASGIVVATGTLPQGAAPTADSRHLIVVEDGQAAAAVRVFDAKTLAAERTIALDGASGAPLADRNGTSFWVSLASKDAIAHIDAATGSTDRTIAIPGPFWAAAIARSPDGKTLAISGESADSVRFIDEASGTLGAAIAVGTHPFGVAYAGDGSKLYVANWGAATLSVIDTATRTVRATIAVGRHPEALLLSADGKRVYVSETDDDTIGIVDTGTDARVASIEISPFGKETSGASPSALAFSRDGKRLFVAESAINAIAVLDIASATPRLLGALPTGWYPTAVVAEGDGTTLDVIDGKGESSRANPQFKPFARIRDQSGYVAHEMIGSIRRIPISGETIARGTQEALDNAKPAFVGVAPGSGFVTNAGPIKHVIYIIKE